MRERAKERRGSRDESRGDQTNDHRSKGDEDEKKIWQNRKSE